MPRIRPDALDAFAKIETIRHAVGFVALEADERQRADIDSSLAAVGLLAREVGAGDHAHAGFLEEAQRHRFVAPDR